MPGGPLKRAHLVGLVWPSFLLQSIVLMPNVRQLMASRLMALGANASRRHEFGTIAPKWIVAEKTEPKQTPLARIAPSWIALGRILWKNIVLKWVTWWRSVVSRIALNQGHRK
jgi:hypothetical protein